MVTIKDMGRQSVADADGSRFDAYVSEVSWECPRCQRAEVGTSVVDVQLAALNDDPAPFRHAEDQAFMKALETQHLCPKT